MAIMGDKMKGLHFNSKFEDYMNKNFGYSELCSIASPPLSEVATENFYIVAFVKIHKTKKEITKLLRKSSNKILTKIFIIFKRGCRLIFELFINVSQLT